MGDNQVTAAVGGGGPHKLETRLVLLALIATSTFNEAYSPSTQLGRSFLAHQVSAVLERCGK